MMENGASGYIIKNASKDELMEAIYAAHRGDIFFSGEAGQALQEYQKSSATELPLLSSREKEILGIMQKATPTRRLRRKYFSVRLQ